MVHRPVLHRIIAQRACLHLFTFVVSLVILDTLKSSIFSVNIFGILQTHQKQQIGIGDLLDGKPKVTLANCLRFIIQGPP